MILACSLVYVKLLKKTARMFILLDRPLSFQGQCDASWAFSAIGALEGQNCIEYRKLVTLSAQNLLDCSSYINDCDGGYVDFAFSYVIKNHGIDTERSYPYEAVVSIVFYFSLRALISTLQS